jgi:hypothetical protein
MEDMICISLAPNITSQFITIVKQINGSSATKFRQFGD